MCKCKDEKEKMRKNNTKINETKRERSEKLPTSSRRA